jgi:FkbM family methyltransferase
MEADPEYFAYLRQNLSYFKKGKFFQVMLASPDGVAQALRRTPGGTASAQGGTAVAASTLDSVLLDSGLQRLDLLKTDVDGMDGQVLLGARRMLERHQPCVIFEWHPGLCRQTANNWTDHFEALAACGYAQFVWFDKYGRFSHFMAGYDRNSTGWLAELCLRNSEVYYDWHYDVIGLPPSCSISPIALAESDFARARRSGY